MSVISDVFETKHAYVGYLTAGDGGFDKSLAIMKAYAESGIDIIEVGVPFSDPVADGPVIQEAASRALKDGFSLSQVLKLIEAFKTEHNTPVVLFTYLNPLLRKGCLDDFFKEAKASGVDGCLVVDLPIEEAQDYHDACCNHDVDPVYLIAPSTTAARIAKISEYGKGMLYYACRRGVTGMRSDLPDDFEQRLTEIKSIANMPVVVGFGVSSKEVAAAILDHADGFVVGSLLVKTAAEQDNATLRQTIKQLDPR